MKLLTEGQEILERKWIKYVVLSKMKFYPLQFANCERLQKMMQCIFLTRSDVGKLLVVDLWL